MKFKFKTLVFPVLLLVFPACGREVLRQAEGAVVQPVTVPVRYASASAYTEDSLRSLDELAALERAGSWFQGMAMTESGIRENAGDYAGAVTAAYKELAWAYGKGMIQKNDVELGILSVLSLGSEEITSAASAVLAFIRERWDEAAAGLEPLFDELEEPDGFGRWMILACALEKNRENRRAGEAYKAIRARYAQFPEYWYRGARAFHGIVGAEYAENCINSSSQGPFADECRNILAVFLGLKIEDGLSIKTKTEIEGIISQSLNAGNPQLLDSLFPLISLPDNPYTVYAVEALRALTSVQKYRDFFSEQAVSSRGRLAERLSYISRG
jgi:hypothetical protein